ncbi:hypothetical protein KIPB_014661, partial [Kipferlia bialata]|eukprot:g14661.t1
MPRYTASACHQPFTQEVVAEPEAENAGGNAQYAPVAPVAEFSNIPATVPIYFSE